MGRKAAGSLCGANGDGEPADFRFLAGRWGFPYSISVDGKAHFRAIWGLRNLPHRALSELVWECDPDLRLWGYSLWLTGLI